MPALQKQNGILGRLRSSMVSNTSLDFGSVPTQLRIP